MSTHYDTLGVTITATDDEIRKSYKKLMLRYHPDKNKSNDAVVKYHSVCKAYEVLSNKTKRQAYNREIQPRRATHPRSTATTATGAMPRGPPQPGASPFYTPGPTFFGAPPPFPRSSNTTRPPYGQPGFRSSYSYAQQAYSAGPGSNTYFMFSQGQDFDSELFANMVFGTSSSSTSARQTQPPYSNQRTENKTKASKNKAANASTRTGAGFQRAEASTEKTTPHSTTAPVFERTQNGYFFKSGEKTSLRPDQPIPQKKPSRYTSQTFSDGSSSAHSMPSNNTSMPSSWQKQEQKFKDVNDNKSNNKKPQSGIRRSVSPNSTTSFPLQENNKKANVPTTDPRKRPAKQHTKSKKKKRSHNKSTLFETAGDKPSTDGIIDLKFEDLAMSDKKPSPRNIRTRTRNYEKSPRSSIPTPKADINRASSANAFRSASGRPLRTTLEDVGEVEFVTEVMSGQLLSDDDHEEEDDQEDGRDEDEEPDDGWGSTHSSERVDLTGEHSDETEFEDARSYEEMMDVDVDNQYSNNGFDNSNSNDNNDDDRKTGREESNIPPKKVEPTSHKRRRESGGSDSSDDEIVEIDEAEFNRNASSPARYSQELHEVSENDKTNKKNEENKKEEMIDEEATSAKKAKKSKNALDTLEDLNSISPFTQTFGEFGLDGISKGLSSIDDQIMLEPDRRRSQFREGRRSGARNRKTKLAEEVIRDEDDEDFAKVENNKEKSPEVDKRKQKEEEDYEKGEDGDDEEDFTDVELIGPREVTFRTPKRLEDWDQVTKEYHDFNLEAIGFMKMLEQKYIRVINSIEKSEVPFIDRMLDLDYVMANEVQRMLQEKQEISERLAKIDKAIQKTHQRYTTLARSERVKSLLKGAKDDE